MENVTYAIDINVQSEGWPDCNDLVSRAVSAAEVIYPEHRKGELSIALSDDARVRILNRDYRGKEKATNVLSFPVPPPAPLLGDIVLAHETVLREAAETGVSFEAHLTHLLIHGWLHLQGFDHETEAEAAEMEALEIAALATLGIDNPYRLADG